MKKLFFVLLLATLIISCKTTSKKAKDYVTLSGKVTNQNSNSLLLLGRKGFFKKIKVKADGTFSDTLKVKTGIHTLFNGREETRIKMYLKNGYNLKITLNTKQFDKTVKYSGEGKEVNNYLSKKSLLTISLQNPTMLNLNKATFIKKVDSVEKGILKSLTKIKGLDANFVANQKKEAIIFERLRLRIYIRSQILNNLGTLDKKSFDNKIQATINSQDSLYLTYKNMGIDSFIAQQKIKDKYYPKEERYLYATKYRPDYLRLHKLDGKPSPKFLNYENFKGGTISR